MTKIKNFIIDVKKDIEGGKILFEELKKIIKQKKFYCPEISWEEECLPPQSIPAINDPEHFSGMQVVMEGDTIKIIPSEGHQDLEWLNTIHLIDEAREKIHQTAPKMLDATESAWLNAMIQMNKN